MQTNKKQYASDYRQLILTAIKERLSDAFEQNKQKVIDNLALKQRELTKSVAGFRYNREAYLHQLVQEPRFKLKRLHADLVDEFNAHLVNWESHQHRQLIVDSTLISALTTMGNINDLWKLLPECLHSVLPERDALEPYLNEKQIEQFHLENQEALSLTKVQLVMGILKG